MARAPSTPVSDRSASGIFLARKDLFVPTHHVGTQCKLPDRIKIVDRGGNRVEVIVNDFTNIDKCIIGKGSKDQYCPNIECGVINVDPKRDLIVAKLKDIEGEYDDGISRLKPSKVFDGEANKNNVIAMYTALYMAYLYSLSKAPRCPKGGVAAAAEQCIGYYAPGKTAAQVFGGGARRRGASRQKLRSSRRTSRKHTRRSHRSKKH
jgi:hypothetical protein